MEIRIFPNISGNDFFFYFLGLSGKPKSPEIGSLRKNLFRKKVKNWVENPLTVCRTYGILLLVATNDSATSLPEWVGSVKRDKKKTLLTKL